MFYELDWNKIEHYSGKCSYVWTVSVVDYEILNSLGTNKLVGCASRDLLMTEGFMCKSSMHSNVFLRIISNAWCQLSKWNKGKSCNAVRVYVKHHQLHKIKHYSGKCSCIWTVSVVDYKIPNGLGTNKLVGCASRNLLMTEGFMCKPSMHANVFLRIISNAWCQLSKWNNGTCTS